MKALISILLILTVCGILIFRDYKSERRKFHLLKKEYELSLEFEKTQELIDIYFYEHGWYPDSLQQLDTIFTHKEISLTLEDIRDTRYRFLVDPFSGGYYYYLPTLNGTYAKPDGYYLLSAGIDSKIDNKGSNHADLNLYDSIYFNYFDLYFGHKDILVKHASIERWLNEVKAIKFSLKRLIVNYDPKGRRKPPRFVEFTGTVEKVNHNSFTVMDSASTAMAHCYLAPTKNTFQPKPGDIINVKGFLSQMQFKPDTILIFLNCWARKNP